MGHALKSSTIVTARSRAAEPRAFRCRQRRRSQLDAVSRGSHAFQLSAAQLLELERQLVPESAAMAGFMPATLTVALPCCSRGA